MLGVGTNGEKILCLELLAFLVEIRGKCYEIKVYFGPQLLPN